MYSAVWSPGLRQGDIFGEIRFPVWSERIEWTFSGGVSLSVLDSPTVGFVKAQQRYVVVISHDCEFNEGKRAFFLVARLENLAKGLSEEQLELLRQANDLSAMENGIQVPLDTFVVDPIEDAFDTPMRANFGTVTPIPMSFLEEARRLKRAEMRHEHRVQLRRKLGYFFGRDADDIPEQEKAPPPAAPT